MARLRFLTRLRLAGLLVREFVRAVLSPVHLLLSLPRAEAARKRFRELVAHADAHENAEQTRAAGRQFRARCPGPVRKVALSCGEASGERHAVALLEQLRAANPELEVHAFGGARLEQMPGVQLHVNLVDRAVFGLTGALAELPFFVGIVGRWMELLDREKPDLVILIDNPGLHLVLAERAKARGIPVLYYICPQYWAWASWRMRRFVKCVDVAMAILPFEAPLFRAAGIPCGFAGHPLLADEASVTPARDREHLLVLLPGSRRSELARHWTGMREIAARMKQVEPDLRIVAPQSNPKFLEQLQEQLGDAPIEVVLDEPRDWLARARLALVKSGTSTMETAISGTPMVICYHLTGYFESFLRRFLVRTPWLGAPNLVLAEEIAPEHVFREDSGWEQVARSLERLLREPESRAAQENALLRVRDRLGGPGAPRELRRWFTARDEAH